MGWFFWRKAAQATPGTQADSSTVKALREADRRLLRIMLGSLVSGGGEEVWRQVACDRDGVVREVKLPQRRLAGSLQLAAAPAQLVHISVSGNSIAGRLDFLDLPAGLKTIDVSRNAFHGELHLTRLPAVLVEVNVSHNQLTGVLELGLLPPQLVALYANDNGFSVVATSSAADMEAAAANGPSAVEMDAEEETNSGDGLVTLYENEFAPALRAAKLASVPVSAVRQCDIGLGGLVIKTAAECDLSKLPATLKFLNVERNPATAVQQKATAVPGRKVTLWW